MPINKKGNEYAAKMGERYARIPKAVWAAIAISYASSGGDLLHDMDAVDDNISREWHALYNNGIVPQQPDKPDPAND